MGIVEDRRHADILRSARKDRNVRRLEIREIRLLRESIEQLLERLPIKEQKERTSDPGE